MQHDLGRQLTLEYNFIELLNVVYTHAVCVNFEKNELLRKQRKRTKQSHVTAEAKALMVDALLNPTKRKPTMTKACYEVTLLRMNEESWGLWKAFNKSIQNGEIHLYRGEKEETQYKANL
ncbi:hypothetical protein L596_021271 [Steinernema carpocapsae]|uniref:Uncharacterized protein n=1 Tax=Steinernema carpocapsae TaxID=34508 RepID=A0A4U5MI41_STECR|nr:hypothetical protein L596_021271 [Steinernema carpocapsae]